MDWFSWMIVIIIGIVALPVLLPLAGILIIIGLAIYGHGVIAAALIIAVALYFTRRGV